MDFSSVRFRRFKHALRRGRRRSSADQTGSYHLFDISHCQEVLDGGRHRQSADASHERDGEVTTDSATAQRLERRRSCTGHTQGEQNVRVVDEVEDDAVAQEGSERVHITVDNDEQMNHGDVVVNDGAVDWSLATAAASTYQRCTNLKSD